MNPLSAPIRIPIEITDQETFATLQWIYKDSAQFQDPNSPAHTIAKIFNELHQECEERAELKDKFEILDNYELNEALEEFNIIHVYPGPLASRRDGYHTARFFDVALFNIETMEYRISSDHDGLDFEGKPAIKKLYVWVDGSTLLHMEQMCSMWTRTQAMTIYTTDHLKIIKAKYAQN